MTNRHTTTTLSRPLLLGLGGIVLLFGGLTSCSIGSDADAAQGDLSQQYGVSDNEPTAHPGQPVGIENPAEFLGDTQHEGGRAQRFRLGKLTYGRLVEVFGLDVEPGEFIQAGTLTGVGQRVPMQSNFVIGQDLSTDFSDFLVEINPVTAQQTLTILRNVLDKTAGGGREQFYDLLVESEAGLTTIVSQGPNSSDIYTMVPRNAALVLHFDDLIDPKTVTSETVRLNTGVLPEDLSDDGSPFEARVFSDQNHGDLRDFGDGVRFYSTRVIVDLTTSELESFATDPPLVVNGVGLPPSVSVNQANLFIRIPSQISAAATPSQTVRLENPSGHAIDVETNGYVDFGSATIPVIRGMRAGGATTVTNDPFNGFLRDELEPRIVGSQPSRIPVAPMSSNPPPAGDGTEFVLSSFEFQSTFCAQTPSPGDIITQGGVFAEVIEQPAPQVGGIVTDLKVRLLLYPADWDEPGQNGPLEWEAAGLGVAEYLSTYDPIADDGKGACFVSVFPTPAGFPENPNEGLSPNSVVTVRFSEPMDPASLTAFDSMTFTRNLVPTDENEPPLPTSDYVVGSLSQSPDLQEFTFVPDLPLAHLGPGDGSVAEDYFLTLTTGDRGASDLAGNALGATTPPLQLLVNPFAATQRNGGRVSRFTSQDEEPPGGGVEGSQPEWSGQHLYDLQRQTIRPRPLSRYSVVADRNEVLPGLMTPFGGIQTPLSSLGSKLQTVWRYADFGMGLTDPVGFNVDIEGMNWAPAGGEIVADHFDQFEIRVSHSRWAVDEYIDPGSLFPNFPNSGLKANYNANKVAGLPWTVLHSKFLGYTVNPADLFLSENDTPLIPFPLNETISAADYERYTWRDTSIRNRVGSNSGGAPPWQEYVAYNLTLPGVLETTQPNATFNAFPPGQVRSIGMPLVMEFRCYPDEGAAGLNSFDISLAINTSAKPYFRAWTTGGTDSNNQIHLVNPDSQDTADGGFNPTSNPPGAGLFGLGPEFYHGGLDLVVRVSRSYSIWFPATDPNTGMPFTGTLAYNLPVVEPRAEDQPDGTQILLSFRGATDITTNDCNNGVLGCDEFEAMHNAQTLDGYGDHYYRATNPLVSPPGTIPSFRPTQENKGIEFLNNDDDWREIDLVDPNPDNGVLGIDGSSYYQIRVTFLSNPQSGLSPELSAVALSWQE